MKRARAWRGPARYGRDLKLCTGVPEDFEAEHPWMGADGASFRRLHVLGASFLGGMQSRRQKRNFCSPPRLQQLPANESLALLGRTRELRVWVVESILAGGMVPQLSPVSTAQQASSCTEAI